MYTIKYYGDILHAPYDEELFLVSPEINTGANQSWTLTAQILSSHPYFGELKILKYGIEIYKDGKFFMRGRIMELEQGLNKLYKLYAEDKLAALNDSHCRPYEFEGPPEELFEWFINNHNSQVSDEQKLLKGNVTVTDPNNYIARSWENGSDTWSLMNSRLLDTLGGYFVVRYEEDGDYLDWLEDFSLYSSQEIRFGENLVDLNKIVSAEDTYTACIPYGAEIIEYVYGEVDADNVSWEADKYYTLSGETYILIQTEDAFNSAVSAGTTIYEVTSSEATGKKLTIESVNDGKDYLINEAAANNYGIIYAPADLVTWDDVTRPENLLTKSSDWLNNEGVMLRESITLTAADLSASGLNIGSFETYQNVMTYIEPLGMQASYLISGMKIDAAASEVLKISIGSTKKTLSSNILDAKKEANSLTQKVDKIEADYTTKGQVTDAINSEISTSASQILQTSEEITLGILAGYTSVSDLNAYKEEVANLFKVNEEGFSFDFNRLQLQIDALGGEIVNQSSYIKLIDGEVRIGGDGNPVTSVFTNNALEFRYNNETVARFTNETLEVRKISAENQVAFFDQWAIRKGAYITGKGYNLNDMWIGG